MEVFIFKVTSSLVFNIFMDVNSDTFFNIIKLELKVKVSSVQNIFGEVKLHLSFL